jgi:glycosyltransferase involved in cell wall biosynthesis
VCHILGISSWPFNDFPDADELFHRRENTVLRGQLFEKTHEDPSTVAVSRNVFVIPNALVADQFKPSQISDLSQPSSKPLCCYALPGRRSCFNFQVTIVVISRLAYRKGIDLLVAAAPRICSAFPNVKFVIGEAPSFPVCWVLLIFVGFFQRWNWAQTERVAANERKTFASRSH